jgi:DNA processing protein
MQVKEGAAMHGDVTREEAAGWLAGAGLAILIALGRLGGLLPSRLIAALRHFGSAEALWRAPASQIAQVSGISQAVADSIAGARGEPFPEGELQRLQKLGIQPVRFSDEEYPDRLRHTFDPPLLLYRMGPPPRWDRVVAVVGTRRSSAAGDAQAFRMGRDLAREGVLVLSGLAVGIDAAAHRGALEAGGSTAALLGGAHDRFYPPRNVFLFEQFLAAGQTVLSEYPPGVPPRAFRFPARNRLVAAIAHAVVVIEAPERSGALVTARFAEEGATEVMVVPGPPESERHTGSHKLLRSGARLVRDAADVLDDLGWHPAEPAQGRLPLRELLSGAEDAVFKALSAGGDRPEQLARRAGLAIPAVLAALSGLQMKDLVIRRPGPTYHRQ